MAPPVLALIVVPLLPEVQYRRDRAKSAVIAMIDLSGQRQDRVNASR
jgi:hypothetical protein